MNMKVEHAIQKSSNKVCKYFFYIYLGSVWLSRWYSMAIEKVNNLIKVIFNQHEIIANINKANKAMWLNSTS